MLTVIRASADPDSIETGLTGCSQNEVRRGWRIGLIGELEINGNSEAFTVVSSAAIFIHRARTELLFDLHMRFRGESIPVFE